MHDKEFDRLLEERLVLARKTLKSKGVEYTPDSNRLHNFDRAAVMRKTTPEDVLMGMKVKHTVSLEDILESIKKGERPPMELIEEKIGDEINYWLILEIIIKRRYANEE